MRIYSTLEEARSELKRDLREMGLVVRTKSYQNKAADDEKFATMELQDYSYRINDVSTLVPKPEDKYWALAELDERLNSTGNPGEAWLLRKEYWEQFLVTCPANGNQQFDYTYGQRLSVQLDYIVDLLQQDPLSRRAILMMWDKYQDDPHDLNTRVPCSIYYHFMIREGGMTVSYHQRSCDLFEHWQNDLWFALQMAEHIARGVSPALEIGAVIHHVGSLHAYNKDLEGVF